MAVAIAFCKKRPLGRHRFSMLNLLRLGPVEIGGEKGPGDALSRAANPLAAAPPRVEVNVCLRTRGGPLQQGCRPGERPRSAIRRSVQHQKKGDPKATLCVAVVLLVGPDGYFFRRNCANRAQRKQSKKQRGWFRNCSRTAADDSCDERIDIQAIDRAVTVHVRQWIEWATDHHLDKRIDIQTVDRTIQVDVAILEDDRRGHGPEISPRAFWRVDTVIIWILIEDDARRTGCRHHLQDLLFNVDESFAAPPAAARPAARR